MNNDEKTGKTVFLNRTLHVHVRGLVNCNRQTDRRINMFCYNQLPTLEQILAKLYHVRLAGRVKVNQIYILQNNKHAFQHRL